MTNAKQVYEWVKTGHWNRQQFLEWTQPQQEPYFKFRECEDSQPAQPEQEPVALEEKFSLLLWDYQELERAFEKVTGGKWVRKSNTPQRKPLTDDELSDIWFKQSTDWMEFARAIEAAHNIKE